jgi:hypothetical protein
VTRCIHSIAPPPEQGAFVIDAALLLRRPRVDPVIHVRIRTSEPRMEVFSGLAVVLPGGRRRKLLLALFLRLTVLTLDAR